MMRTYRFRLRPTPLQEVALHSMLGAFCDLYNAGLQERVDCYGKTGRSLTYNTQALQLKEVREIDERLAIFSFTAEQQVLRRLDKSFNAFFARCKRGDKPGFPRYRSKSRFDSAEFRVGDGLVIKQERLRIVGINGLIKVRWHREFPEDAKLGHAVLSRKGGKWHICFAVASPDYTPILREFNPIGIDLGITHLVALSDDSPPINAPRFTREAEKVQRIHQRTLARRKRGSRGWKKARVILRRHSARTAAQRRDFLHKLSTTLVREYSHIAVEDLNIKGLSRGMLSKDILSASWGQLLQMIHYKAACAGSVIEAVDPRGTSQTCSACGAIVPKTLAVRLHDCSHCGYVADRDLNAAQNVLARAKFMGPGIGLAASRQAVAPNLAAEAVCFS